MLIITVAKIIVTTIIVIVTVQCQSIPRKNFFLKILHDDLNDMHNNNLAKSEK